MTHIDLVHAIKAEREHESDEYLTGLPQYPPRVTQAYNDALSFIYDMNVNGCHIPHDVMLS